MGPARRSERLQSEMIRLCHSALDSRMLRTQLLNRLQHAVPFDYAYFTAADPATGIGVGTVMAEPPPPWVMGVFVENEYLQDDYNAFSAMWRDRQPVAILSESAGTQLPQSPRYRDMLAPLGMGDELRAVFVSGTVCWGMLCLHRQGSPYTPAEAGFVARLALHIADGLRKAYVLDHLVRGDAPEGHGVLVLAEDLSIVAQTATVEYWLSELRETEHSERGALPFVVHGVAARLKLLERGDADASAPMARLQTAKGQWLTLSASRLHAQDAASHIAVMFASARPADLAPIMTQAYMLSQREAEIVQCVVRGWSTNEISRQLHISPLTVQDHLKAIFGKVDVSSRGELVARIYRQQHRPE